MLAHSLQHAKQNHSWYLMKWVQIQPHTPLQSPHPLPSYVVPLQIDKETREPTGTVIQYWNLTVSDQIWWTVILSSLPWPDGLQYRSDPSERSVSHCSPLPPTHPPPNTHTHTRMSKGKDERLLFRGRDYQQARPVQHTKNVKQYHKKGCSRLVGTCVYQRVITMSKLRRTPPAPTDCNTTANEPGFSIVRSLSSNWKKI